MRIYVRRQLLDSVDAEEELLVGAVPEEEMKTRMSKAVSVSSLAFALVASYWS